MHHEIPSGLMLCCTSLCLLPVCISAVNCEQLYLCCTSQQEENQTSLIKLQLLTLCPAGGALCKPGRSRAQLCPPPAHQQGPGGAVRLESAATWRRAAGWRGQRGASARWCSRLDSGAWRSDGSWESECVYPHLGSYSHHRSSSPEFP